MVSHGLGPHYHNAVVRDLKNADTYILGTNGSTFKVGGLSKHVDLVLRFWLEVYGCVVDVYLDTHSFSREPADKQVCFYMMKLKQILTKICFQVKAFVKSLTKDGISLANLLQLSRDDPNLMKSVHNKLETETKEVGNPMLLSGPCSIHPVHTAFKTGLGTLADMTELDIVSLLKKLHTWFKISTARREDMLGLFEMCDEIVLFFHRLVDTRWLCMEPALERFLEHTDSAKEYFLYFLPSSQDQSNKKAIKTDNYKEIVKYFKPSNEIKTLCSAKFALFLAKLYKHFLIQLQHQKPMIHCLYELCCQLVLKFMNLIVEPEKIPNDSPLLKKLNLDDKKNLLPPSSCNFGEGVKKLLGKLKSEDRPQMMEAF